MAYDQQAAYEPPRRAYMQQKHQQQSNPGYADYADYNSGPYGQDNYSQGGYSQHYDQQQNWGYDYRNDRGYEQQDQRYDGNYDRGGYDAGYQAPQQHGNEGYYREDEQRMYDPRYQQRGQRGPPQQHAPPGPGPGTRGQPPPGRAPPYQGDPRGFPRQNDPSRPPAQRRGGPQEQQSGYPSNAQQGAGSYDQRGDNVPQAQFQRPTAEYERRNDQHTSPSRRDDYRQPPNAQQPSAMNGKMSMEEWKAQEKAKFKQTAASQESASFDNAFPVFGKKSQDRPVNKSGGENKRGSEEQSVRPQTANGQRPHTAREHSYKSDRDVQSPPRGSEMDHKYSAEAMSGQPPNRQDMYPGQKRDVTTPTREEYPEHWPMIPGQTPPKAQIDRRPVPQANGSHPRYNSNTNRKHSNTQDYEQRSQNIGSQGLQQQHGVPNLQRIDTGQAKDQVRPMYTDQSPETLAQRPSTAHGQRAAAPSHQLSSPLAQYAESTLPQANFNSVSGQPANAYAPEQTRYIPHGDNYGYNSSTPLHAPQRAPQTREEEIEAEMPNFDSASPSQTSSMHKRMQTVDQHLDNNPMVVSPPPPMPRVPTAPPASMQQSQYAHSTGYTPRGYVPQPESGPGLNGAMSRGPMAISHGANSTPVSAQDRQYGIPYRNSPAPDPRYQQEAPLLLPQAPYANEPQTRRSMDDQREGAYRPGPSQPQRFYPNGQPVRGPYPPQRRPDLDRNATGQTVWSDPGQERVGSVPPPQDDIRGTSMSTSTPLAGQRSIPDKSDRQGNPKTLPNHPVPVRAGHIPQGQAPPSKPPPVRNYGGGQDSVPSQNQPSVDQPTQAVSLEELGRLRGAADNGPYNPKQALILVKKLVKASSVLANEGGRADARTAAKNRERYLNEAYKRLKKLVAAGYPDAMFYMADCYGQGSLGLEADTKEAFKLYQAAAKAGHGQAAYRTAVCCEMGSEEGGGTSRDYAKAVQWYRRAAVLGDSAAMYKLGVVLLKGLLGTQRNVGEAMTWLKRAADKADNENPHALHELGTLYESSNTNAEVRNKVVPDDGYARDLYMQAAKLGYKFSQFRLGQAYEYGTLGLPISNRDSIAWYTKAAAQGEHQAELALSGWYLTGAEGILEHSDTEAYLWARKAASSEGGPQVGKAMFAMGYFTENGIGCPRSLEEARKWYGRAASYKFPKAIERLEELRRTGGKGNGQKPAPVSGRLTRKDQKRDEENCVVM